MTGLQVGSTSYITPGYGYILPIFAHKRKVLGQGMEVVQIEDSNSIHLGGGSNDESGLREINLGIEVSRTQSRYANHHLGTAKDVYDSLRWLNSVF